MPRISDAAYRSDDDKLGFMKFAAPFRSFLLASARVGLGTVKSSFDEKEMPVSASLPSSPAHPLHALGQFDGRLN